MLSFWKLSLTRPDDTLINCSKIVMRQSYFLQTNLISHADLNVALSWKTTSLLNKALLFDILKKQSNTGEMAGFCYKAFKFPKSIPLSQLMLQPSWERKKT